MIVDRYAKQFAVVDGRCASVDCGTTYLGFEGHRRAPDLPAGFDVDGERPRPVDDIHDAVVDDRRGQFTQVIAQTRVPDRHESPNVRFVDLVERAVALSVEPHALGHDVVGLVRVVDQLVHRLGHPVDGPDTQ